MSKPLEEILAAATRNDPVACQLERLHTFLSWIHEHRASFEKQRHLQPELAEAELRYLAHSTEEAKRHLAKLTQMLLAGQTIDCTKRLPRGPWNSDSDGEW
jgi:hypothetical protein